jgi:hypothetical protein
MPRSHELIGEGEEWASVYVASNPFEADLVRGLLDEESIPTLREAEAGSFLLWKSTGLRILVPRHDEALAREILRAYQGRDLNVINLADYMPGRGPTRRTATPERLLPLLALPLLALLILALALVVHKW